MTATAVLPAGLCNGGGSCLRSAFESLRTSGARLVRVRAGVPLAGRRDSSRRSVISRTAVVRAQNDNIEQAEPQVGPFGNRGVMR